jgi:hypothetical protein
MPQLFIVHGQVSQLESTLAKERNEQAELMQRIEQLEAQDEARLQHFAGQEKARCVQVSVKEKTKVVCVLYFTTSLMPVLHNKDW